LDGKLRLWNIPDKKIALWNEVSGTTKLITAANFCLNGRFAVVGTYDGRCIFYSTDVSEQFGLYVVLIVILLWRAHVVGEQFLNGTSSL